MRRIGYLTAGFVLILVSSFAVRLPANAEDDTTPPTLVDFAFTPTTVDTSRDPAVITFTLRLVDDQSGGDYTVVEVAGPSGGQWHSERFDRVTGDPLDGIYQGTITLPPFSERGTWTVQGIFWKDLAGNTAQWNTTAIGAAGFPTTLQQTGRGETTPPRLRAFSLAPTSIDTTSAPATITYSLRVSDSQAGVDYAVVELGDPLNQSRGERIDADDRTSGSPRDGQYQLAVIIPSGSPHGTWTVRNVALIDRAGNDTTLTTAQLEAAKFVTTFSNG